MERVIPYLSRDELLDLAKCVGWQPLNPGIDEAAWLEIVRAGLYEEIKKAGRSRWGNFWDTAGRVSYRDSVREVAKALDVSFENWDSVPAIETKIIDALSRSVMAKMTPQEKEAWLSQIREEAKKHGIRVGVEAAGLGAIGLAQLSGFGIYLAASTVLGAINSVLGLGLGFGVFAGMSKLIAFAIGPWAAALFVFPLLFKAASADPKRLLPIVACIAFLRSSRGVRLAEACDENDRAKALTLVTEMNYREGGAALKAMCDGQPAKRHTVPYFMVRFLAGAMLGAVDTDSLESIVSLAVPDEREWIAERIIAQVERLVPEMLDAVLLAFLSVNFCSSRLCYLSSPKGSASEFVCVTAIATKISDSLPVHQGV